MSQITDKELLDLFQNPETEKQGFNLIVRNFQERIYWHVRKIVISHDDANDVVQNTFIKSWKGLLNFRGDSKLYTWLYRIATNEAITFLRKKRKHTFVNIDDLAEGLITKIEGPFFDGNEIEKKLQKAILTLPTKQRIVFNMRYYEEIKYEELALILDTSVGALKASYHHAKNKIEDYLKTN
jgi:RNA polymerase sigma-70 factor (ECF subfamily)